MHVLLGALLVGSIMPGRRRPAGIHTVVLLLLPFFVAGIALGYLLPSHQQGWTMAQPPLWQHSLSSQPGAP
eukprot:jgi/Chlat1/3559/Chrsp234S03592